MAEILHIEITIPRPPPMGGEVISYFIFQQTFKIIIIINFKIIVKLIPYSGTIISE